MEGPTIQSEENLFELPPLHTLHHIDSNSVEFTMPSTEGDVRFTFGRKNGVLTYLGADHGGSEQLRKNTLSKGKTFALELFRKFDSRSHAPEDGESSENEVMVGKIIMECRKQLGDSEDTWDVGDIRKIIAELFPTLSDSEIDEKSTEVLRSVQDTRSFNWSEK